MKKNITNPYFNTLIRCIIIFFKSFCFLSDRSLNPVKEKTLVNVPRQMASFVKSVLCPLNQKKKEMRKVRQNRLEAILT